MWPQSNWAIKLKFADCETIYHVSNHDSYQEHLQGLTLHAVYGTVETSQTTTKFHCMTAKDRTRTLTKVAKQAACAANHVASTHISYKLTTYKVHPQMTPMYKCCSRMTLDTMWWGESRKLTVLLRWLKLKDGVQMLLSSTGPTKETRLQQCASQPFLVLFQRIYAKYLLQMLPLPSGSQKIHLPPRHQIFFTSQKISCPSISNYAWPSVFFQQHQAQTSLKDSVCFTGSVLREC